MVGKDASRFQLKLGGAVVPLVKAVVPVGALAVVPLVGAVVPLGSGKLDRGDTLRKWMISGAKLDGFRGWKVGKLVGKLDLPATHEIHGSNPTKFHHTNKSQKKFGAIFGGDSWI